MSIGYLKQYLYIILFDIICVMGFYLQYFFLHCVPECAFNIDRSQSF